MADGADAKRRSAIAIRARERSAPGFNPETVRQTQRKQVAERGTQEGRDAATKAETQRKADARTTEERRREAITRTALKRVEEVRRTTEQRRLQRQKDETRKAFNRLAENRKAADEAARTKAAERRAIAEVQARQKQQREDQLVEHRRQTDEVRRQHRAETRSLRSNERDAVERHHHAVRGIDDREERTLGTFDRQCAGLKGRVVEAVKGKAHVDRQREQLKQGFESDRMRKHRDLEALKERQFKVAQDTRLRQAHERKAMFEGHLASRLDLGQRQEAHRGRQVEARAQAIKAAELQRAPSHTRDQAHGPGMAR